MTSVLLINQDCKPMALHNPSQYSGMKASDSSLPNPNEISHLNLLPFCLPMTDQQVDTHHLNPTDDDTSTLTAVTTDEPSLEQLTTPTTATYTNEEGQHLGMTTQLVVSQIDEAIVRTKINFLQNLEEDMLRRRDELSQLVTEESNSLDEHLNQLKAQICSVLQMAHTINEERSQFGYTNAANHLNPTQNLMVDLKTTSQCHSSDLALCIPNNDVLPSLTNDSIDPQKPEVWHFERRLGVKEDEGKLSSACGIATNYNGDVAVADMGSANVNVYDHFGQLKTSMDTSQGLSQGKISHVREVAVTSDEKYFVTDKTEYVRIFNKEGKYVHKFATLSPQIDEPSSQAMPLQLSGLAIDVCGHLLVGEVKNKYISRHHTDGSHICSIETNIAPWYLATTSLGTIVISSAIEQTVQIIDHTGRLLYTLHGPDNWMPTGVCCSADTIYVCNFASDCNGVYTFSVFGDYIGCITRDVIDPTGVALTADGDSLIVAQWGRRGMKIFTRK